MTGPVLVFLAYQVVLAVQAVLLPVVGLLLRIPAREITLGSGPRIGSGTIRGIAWRLPPR